MIVMKRRYANLQDHSGHITLRVPRFLLKILLKKIKIITQQTKIEAKALILLKDILEG